MDIFEAIRQRRSIRSYTDEDVTEEEINILLEAAIRV
jgi:nitroreductase